jgi:hypothetical protein
MLTLSLLGKSRTKQKTRRMSRYYASVKTAGIFPQDPVVVYT